MENFDPKIHKLFRVNVLIEYGTYVVAENDEEAERLAYRYTDRYADEESTLTATEVQDIPEYCRSELAWGPITYEGKELNLGEIVDLLKPPPEAEPEAELKEVVIDTKMPLNVYTPIPELTDWATKRGIKL